MRGVFQRDGIETGKVLRQLANNETNVAGAVIKEESSRRQGQRNNGGPS